MKGYDLIIPVYNEKKIISLIDYLLECSKNFNKILICYDDVNDITLEKIKDSKYINSPKIDFIKNPFNGPCEAIKAGIIKSHSESVIIYPADDYNNAHLLDRMYVLFENGYDVVCPSRFMKGGIIKNCPLIKLLIVRLVSFFLYNLSNINVKDPTNGFRLFSKKLINKHLIESKNGFACSLELLVKAKKNNFKIIEIPSIWIERNDRKSNFKILKWSKNYLKWFFIAIFN